MKTQKFPFSLISWSMLLLMAMIFLGPAKMAMATQESKADNSTSFYKQLLAPWVNFWNTYDLNMINQLFLTDERLSYFSSEKQGLIRGFENVVKHHQGFGFVPGGKATSNRLWVEDVQGVNCGETLVVTAIWFFQRAEGKTQKGPMTVVYIREGEKYKIAHMHFSNYSTD